MTIPTIDYQGEEAFWNWMKKVVANEALCYLRERKRLLFADQDLATPQISDEDEPQPERLSTEELQRLISELPDGYRTVINLHIFEGYPHKKIAELLGITESTSSSQLYFAKRVLAKRIKELLNDK